MPIELGSFSIGAVAGSLVTALANHFLAQSRNRKERELQQFNTCADEFTKFFDGLLDKISNPIAGTSFDDPNEENNCVYSILKSSFDDQGKAIEKFKRILSDKERDQFKQAWEAFYKPLDTSNLHDFEQRTYFFDKYISTTKEEEEELRKKAVGQIQTLLRFAQHK